MLYQTQARIHLGSIVANLAAIRRTIGSRKLLVSVKANAYGHGAVQVGRLEESCGVDWLGVATVPEALHIRAAGIKLPILKLSGTFPEEMEAAVAASVTLTVGDGATVRRLDAVCAALGAKGRVHLEIETGMGRSGATVEEAPALAGFIERE
jgi:alanine racemase